MSRGDRITHRRHGAGTVQRLLGARDDEGIRVKLDSGRMRDVWFIAGDKQAWTKVRKEP